MPLGNLGGSGIDPRRYDLALRTLSETFQVNPIVARIRLEGLFPGEAKGQMVL
jgi:hypothetical protein